MASKRKAQDKDVNSGVNVAGTNTQRKKARLGEARKISVQFSEPRQQNTSSSSSMEGLPSTIDVEKFAEIRGYEINAMKQAMDNVASAGTQRVWQSLPRHLRRRAASHDVRHVPARLRQKARAEMDTSAKPSSKNRLPRRGKAKALTRTEEFLKRQQDKSWLETHIWHAKRMHMENMWGYRLAKTPTEKAFRPSHRASVHGCILHDASYEAIIELSGPEGVLKEILARCSDPRTVSPGAVRFISGSRVCYTHIYKSWSYPFDLVGPVEILWKTITSSSPQVQSESSKRRDNQRQKASIRTIWVRCHPVIYDAAVSAITYCVQAYLQEAQSASKKEINVEVADLRDQFNTFELVGPKSSQVIHGALSPVKSEEREEFKKFWKALGQLQTAGSVPRGMVVGMKVLDPRLNFPPKNTKIQMNANSKGNLSLPTGLWPTAKLAESELWDNDVRTRLCTPRFKKKDIDSRKSKHLVPGSELNPLRQDNRVPLLLIQRSLEPQGSSSSSSSSSSSLSIQNTSNNTRPLHGWTLVIPKGWGMSFFSSLTHTGTRVGGQDEITTQHFEAGCTMFPVDYPCTEAYTACAEERGRKERERWERKPPAKRPNWEKLGTESPWVPDWYGLLGLQKTYSGPQTDGAADLVPTQRDPPQSTVEGETSTQKTIAGETGKDFDIRPWIFRGSETLSSIETLSHSPNPAPDLLAKLNALRAKRSLPVLSLSADALLQSALVIVRLSIPQSGSPEDNAIIYKMHDDEAKKWRSLVEEAESEFTETQLSELEYSRDALVGYVTSGHYSLSVGRGQAIGAVSLKRYLEMKEQLYRLGKPRALPLVKIRNKNSPICRAAFIELLC
ncbi:POP1 [Sanghuangporus vaninii]